MRQATSTTLTVASLAAGGCGLAKGAVQLTKLCRAPSQIEKISKFLGKGGQKGVCAAQKIALVAERNLVKKGANLGKQKRISRIEGEISEWLGKESRMIKNKAGDAVFLSKDMDRRVRFDFLRPNPHNNPHMHIEELIKGEWKGPRIYPIDVAHN